MLITCFSELIGGRTVVNLHCLFISFVYVACSPVLRRLWCQAEHSVHLVLFLALNGALSQLFFAFLPGEWTNSTFLTFLE